MELLGATMIILLFAGMFCWVWFDSGFMDAVIVFGASFAIIAWVYVAVWLFKGG